MAPDSDALDPFIPWLLQQAGVAADAYRPGVLRRRLPACLRALRVSSPADARTILEQQPDLVHQAISTILIGVSGFFRDPEVWDCLQARHLPEFLRQRRALRVHSAGCSDGQELYSMAILLDELGALEGSVLLGEDCRLDAIDQARVAIYNASDVEDVSNHRMGRYFLQADSRHCVVPKLRDHVGWRVRDLFGSYASGDWDILMFRNVAIYMEISQVNLLWERLCGQMALGGILVTGKAERPPADLPLVRVSTCIYRKTGG